MPENDDTVTAIARDVTAVVAAIPGASVAVMEIAPQIDLRTIDTRRIIVTPGDYFRGFDETGATRSRAGVRCTVEVGIVERVADDDALIERLRLSDQIAQALDRASVANGRGVVTGIEFSPYYERSLYQQRRLFVSVIIATVKVF